MARLFLVAALVAAGTLPAHAEDNTTNATTPQESRTTPRGYPMRGANGHYVVDTPLAAFATPFEPKISPYLYLNRCTGGCVVHGTQIDDARQNNSAIPSPGDHTITEYEAHVNGTKVTGAAADDEWNQVVQCMKEVYSPFNITVTDQKPVGLSYTMAIIAGNPQEVGLDGGILGIAPLASDCSAQDNVISFSFANWETAPSRVYNVCWTAAQETAHAFGLDHEYQFSDGTSACNDPMTYRFDCGGEKFFRNKAAQCGESAVRTCRCGGSQNSHVKIRSVFGDGTSIIPAPTCTMTPPTGGTISNGGVVTV